MSRLPAMPEVLVLTTAEADGPLLDAIRELLDDAFAGAFSPEDWQHTIGAFHAIVRDGDAVVAHAAVVPRTLEIDGRPVQAGYVEGVATAPARQGEGLGSVVMTALEDVLRREFEMGALSTDRHRLVGRPHSCAGFA
ncbi:MAG: GNAT family N-acetyltransferase, partial [Acidimicrobiia bacterium]